MRVVGLSAVLMLKKWQMARGALVKQGYVNINDRLCKNLQ